MKPASRPQYYRIKRIVDMVREGSEAGYLPNRSDFRRERGFQIRQLQQALAIHRQIRHPDSLALQRPATTQHLGMFHRRGDKTPPPPGIWPPSPRRCSRR